MGRIVESFVLKYIHVILCFIDHILCLNGVFGIRYKFYTDIQFPLLIGGSGSRIDHLLPVARAVGEPRVGHVVGRVIEGFGVHGLIPTVPEVHPITGVVQPNTGDAPVKYQVLARIYGGRARDGIWGGPLVDYIVQGPTGNIDLCGSPVVEFYPLVVTPVDIPGAVPVRGGVGQELVDYHVTGPGGVPGCLYLLGGMFQGRVVLEVFTV